MPSRADPTAQSRQATLARRPAGNLGPLDSGERRVLNGLGEAEALSARAIGQMLDLADAAADRDPVAARDAEALHTPTFPSSEIERLVRNRLDEIPLELANPGRRAT